MPVTHLASEPEPFPCPTSVQEPAHTNSAHPHLPTAYGLYFPTASRGWKSPARQGWAQNCAGEDCSRRDDGSVSGCGHTTRSHPRLNPTNPHPKTRRTASGGCKCSRLGVPPVLASLRTMRKITRACRRHSLLDDFFPRCSLSTTSSRQTTRGR